MSGPGEERGPSAPAAPRRALATRRAGAAALAALAAGACGEPALPPAPERPGTPWLEECAAQRGLLFEHVSGHGERCLFPEIIAGGCGLLDVDADGDLDAYLVQSGFLAPGSPPSPSDALFLNDGRGRFAAAPAPAGARESAYGMGLAAGDADEDGRIDLYVLNLGPNALLRNEGGARFRDATAEAGVGDPSWSVSAAFFDAENDGDLDLFVVNYIAWSLGSEITCTRVINESPDYCSPKQYLAPAPDVFYRNDGTGRFRDASAEAGLRTAFGNGLGVVVLDQDGDGWSDVFVANDGTANQMWHNDGGRGFADEAMRRGFAFDQHGFAKAGMGIAAADVDGDGDEDVLVVNQGGESDSFYRNDDGRFLFDSTLQLGLGAASRPFTRFGVVLADLDDDGWPDLYEANGRVERANDPAPGSDPYAEENLLLRGGASIRFEEVLPRGGTRAALVATSRGAAVGDVDGDGALDLLVVNRDGPAHLLRNVVPGRGHWLAVRVLERSGRDALDAGLSVLAGDRRRLFRVRSGSSYASASDPTVHVGLGPLEEVQDLVVRWADGVEEAFGPAPADRTVVLRRGQGQTSR